MWRCLFHLLLYEDIFHVGGTSSKGNAYPRGFHTYPCDLLPERYGVSGCPPVRCGYFRRCSQSIRGKLARMRSLVGSQVYTEVRGLFNKYYGGGSGEGTDTTNSTNTIGGHLVDVDTDVQEVSEDYLLGDQCYVDVDGHVVASFAQAVGGAALSVIVGEMARQPESYFRGMPDLMLAGGHRVRGRVRCRVCITRIGE